MKLVFMGTPDFAVPSLQALYEAGHEIVGVFTQPDRPSGRGNKLTASQVKNLALTLNLPVFQHQKIKTPEAVEILKKLQPECIVVVAFGQILSKEILSLPRFGCVNVHASILPYYRGAAPIHWAVINGERETGVTTMLMDEGLDTGDMLLTGKYRIAETDTTGDVHDTLAKIGAAILIETIQGLQKGTLMPKSQPEEYTYAPLLKREHERLDWTWSAWTIHNRIRGLNPWPGAFTTFRDEPVKVWISRISDKKRYENRQHLLTPGQIIAVTESGFVIATGEGFLEIGEIQPAGKKRMKALDFYNGRRVSIGELFI